LGHALRQGLRQKGVLPIWAAHLGAKRQVIEVIGAQVVTMAEQQHPGAAAHGARLGQGQHPGVLKKPGSDQKVAVATHKKNRLG